MINIIKLCITKTIFTTTSKTKDPKTQFTQKFEWVTHNKDDEDFKKIYVILLKEKFQDYVPK